MSGSPNFPLQIAIDDRLAAGAPEKDPPIGPLEDPVYDDVPEDHGYPYVVIGNFTGMGNDTAGRTGRDVTVTIHVWSRHEGKREAEEILDHIDRLLNRWQPTVDGWEADQMLTDFGPQVLTDAGNDETRHGVARYRIHLTRPAS